MENELTKSNEGQQILIQQAIEKGADLDKLEKLFEMQLRWEANEAKKAYVKAMAAFKENPPKITKDSKVDFNSSKGRTNYNYANLGDVTNKLTPALSKHGLTATWKTKQNGKIEVTCIMTHVMGHYEETTLSADSDQSGNKNSIQAIGSTITYLQRYSLLAICGLATYEQDTDGMNKEQECITAEQAKEIDKLVKEKGVDVVKFLVYMKVDSYNEILATNYQTAVNTLKNYTRKEPK